MPEDERAPDQVQGIPGQARVKRSESERKEILARAMGHQEQSGPLAEARTSQQIQDQSDSDDIRSGDAAIPNFLAVFFVMFGLWGLWYFAFHLAPLDQPEPVSVLVARPTEVRSYQLAVADPAVKSLPSVFDPTGEFAAFNLTPDTARLRTGAALFQARCAQCHGADGQGRATPLEAATIQGDSLIWTLPPDRVAQLVHYGFEGLMPQWGNDQDQRSLADVVAYLTDVLAPAPGTIQALDITKSGINASVPMSTFTKPWERADGVYLPSSKSGAKK